MSQHTILVTGGTGLVGAHLLAHLSLQDLTVKAIYRTESKLETVKTVFSYYTSDIEALFRKITWIKADINDVPALQDAFLDVEEVYHCAAIVSFLQKDYEIMRKVNIEGTANMVNLSLAFGVKKFCYVSSIATFDKKADLSVIKEENEWNLENNNYGYAISKYGGEMEVWRATQEGLPVIIVNPGVILGAGFWSSNTGLFFTNASKGFKYYTEGITGFVGVKDVVRAMTTAMNSSVYNERYILVSENLDFKSVLTQIAVYMQKPVPHIKITKFLSEIAWRLSTFFSYFSDSKPLITKQSAKASHQKYLYSSEKIIKTFDFSFTPIPEVLKECVNNYKKS